MTTLLEKLINGQEQSTRPDCSAWTTSTGTNTMLAGLAWPGLWGRSHRRAKLGGGVKCKYIWKVANLLNYWSTSPDVPGWLGKKSDENEEAIIGSKDSSKDSSKENVESAKTLPDPSVPLESTSQDATILIPDGWAMPWSNSLLRQRIDEREKEPGCGGGLRRREHHESSTIVKAYYVWLDFSNVDPTDPAASFIAANALKDLAYYTFEREAHFGESHSDISSTAFYVIDTDQHRQITLDTQSCSGRQPSVPDKDKVLHSLFSQVQSHILTA